ncbi:MAG: Pyruvate kinase [Patescibacteria group bacterium]|nr:Pyruvate kinase [Patescibacteria group bacterium]
MNTIEHSLNHKVPGLVLEETKRVKILATVGPATSSKQKIEEMLGAGTDGFRLNFSHGTHSEKAKAIATIREAAAKIGKPVSIVQDLCGPKIRLGKFEGQAIALNAGSIWYLHYKGEFNNSTKILPVEFDLSLNTEVGQIVYIADGRLKAQIAEVDKAKNKVSIKIINGGVVSSGKGLNLPDTDFSGLVITEKDIEDAKFGVDKGIDYVAISFIQSVDDVKYFRNLLKSIGSEAKIISKIETKKAVENLEQIIIESDGVMVARGDLSTEVGPESVPILQRKIIGLCIQNHKFAIVATQMLASMVVSPEPTRAEVSDVATAVIVGTDCVMLSEETAIGSYPVEAIATMKRIILYTQKNNNVRAVFKTKTHQETISEAIASTVIELANIVGAKAIVVETSTGRSAIHVSSHRPERTIIAVTSNPVSAQQLAIIYGIKSFIRPVEKLAATKLTNWLGRGGVLNPGDVVVTASGHYPGKVGGTDTIKVRII